MRILFATLFVISILELSAQSQPITFSVYFEKGKADINPADVLTINDFLALAKTHPIMLFFKRICRPGWHECRQYEFVGAACK
jgi:hypothetical protein